MTNEQIEQLLWKRRDGELSGEEAAILEQALAESAEARQLAREVDGVAERLEEVAASAPPAELRDRIDAALGAAENFSNTSTFSSPRPFRRRWRHAPVLRYAALAATLAVAIVGGWIVSSRRPPASESSHYVGTMENPPGVGGASQSFDLGAGVGSVTVLQATGQCTFNLDLKETGRAELELRAAGRTGVDITIRRFTGSDETAPQVVPGAVIWTVHPPGKFSLSVATTPSDADLDFVVRVGDQEVLHRQLTRLRKGS